MLAVSPSKHGSLLIVIAVLGLTMLFSATQSIDRAQGIQSSHLSHQQVGEGSVRTTSQSYDSLLHVSPLIREQILCRESSQKLWEFLCAANFFRKVDERLLKGDEEAPGSNHVHIFQIGAHLGFEKNDPMARGLVDFLKLLSEEERQRVHWYFVEPSPYNTKGLVENLESHSDLCHLKAIQAAIVHDGTPSDGGNITFYAISDTIDPETGYDDKSGKQLPYWVTQLGSFSRDMVLKEKRVFDRLDLDINDYIVEIEVEGKSLTQLIAEQTALHSPPEAPIQPPTLVLIDTEGFDCKIILGTADDSPYWPPYLLYEIRHCGREGIEQARNKLTGLGYVVASIDGENDLGVRRKPRPSGNS